MKNEKKRKMRKEDLKNETKYCEYQKSKSKFICKRNQGEVWKSEDI